MNLRTLRSTGVAGLGATTLGLALAAGAVVPSASATGVTGATSASAGTAALPSTADAAPGPRIPGSFPLARGVGDDADLTVLGPQRRIEGLGLVADCGQTLMWPPAGYAQRLALEVRGPERGLDRELVTFRSARGAVRAMTTLRRTLRQCPERTRDVVGQRTVVNAHDTDSGWADVAWSQQHPRGSNDISGHATQVVRVGSALLASRSSSEIGQGRAAGRGAVEVLVEQNRRITPAMCRWTVRGC